MTETLTPTFAARLRRAAPWALLAAVLCLTAGSSPARGDLFGQIGIASVGTIEGGLPEQAEYARDAAISGNGRYVAFDGSVGGVTGVWRWDEATHELAQVAGGDAELPSISEDGRYVSFTTNEGASLPAITHEQRLLEPEPEAPNVYVRDMDVRPLGSSSEEAEVRPEPAERAFQVVSARSGSDEPLSYAEAGTTLGASAVGRSAISADGNEVAFVTTAVSDLVEGTPEAPATPPLQVAVRYLNTQATQLVSEEYDPETDTWTGRPVSVPGQPKFGAVYPGTPGGVGFRLPPTNNKWAGDPPPGASISADGSTVAWMGEDISRQAPMLAGERPSPLYTEPLWRRIAPGSETHTERVTGGSQPESQACRESGETSLPADSSQSPTDPCQGPFVVQENAEREGSRGVWSESDGGDADFVPRLSADGEEVAFLATALPTGFGDALTGSFEGDKDDAYVANMSPGLTRREALTPLTEVAGTNFASSGEVTDVSISPDGSQVAFTTRRTLFTLSFPALVSPALAEPGESELFDADLADGTLTQVTHGTEGEASYQPHPSKLSQHGTEEDVYGNDVYIGAFSPSFSADGNVLAFSSTASNLVYGDGNTPTPEPPAEGPFDGSDAFLVARIPFVSTPTTNAVSSLPSAATDPVWSIGATASSRRDGSVAMFVLLPGPGSLQLAARSDVTVTVRHGRRARAAVRTVTVAKAARTAGGGPGVIEVTLSPSTAYAALAARRGGLPATVSVDFSAAGHPTLHQTLEVDFARTVKAAAAHSSRKRRSRRRGGSR